MADEIDTCVLCSPLSCSFSCLLSIYTRADPDAEVVALSPRTLLESDRYVCEICGQGFQREQNLQMHRRRHKVPWRLVKRAPPPAGGGEDGAGAGANNSSTAGTGVGGGGGGGPRKRVFVCPEPSCLHHDPAHALGDLVGIKKHFRRKHGGRRQWVCARCAKGYAVQSDYKAHLKTCGTRGHSCDCGRVFSRYVRTAISRVSYTLHACAHVYETWPVHEPGRARRIYVLRSIARSGPVGSETDRLAWR
jgi:hypothetical protein